MLDDDEDQFYCWLRMYGTDGRPAVRLLKASAYKDCDDGTGVSFSDWNNVGPVVLPKRRELVSGLTESVSLVITNESAQWLEDVDDSWFHVDEGKSGPENPVGKNAESDDDESRLDDTAAGKEGQS